MNRSEYLLRRLVLMIPVLLGVTVITFLLIRAIPGDPAAIMLGIHARPDSIAALRHQLGLDRSVPVQYGIYLRDLLHLDLGDSLKFKIPVSELIQKRLGVSLLLIGLATSLTVVISLPLGILSALWKDSIFDQAVRVFLMITLVMPAFWVGILLLILFSVKLDMFPVSGYGESFADHIHHLFLPALTVALSLSPILVRSLRGSILETMHADYVRTARAKGLGEKSVINAHVLRNALIPSVTLLGLSVGYLMGGTVIVERVFSLPGAGALLVDSIGSRDYPVVQAMTLIFATIVILVNVLTDVIYTFLDPRVRLS